MIEFTLHADRKIKQRKLKKAWVRETLKKPEFVIPSYGNRKIAYKKIGKLYLAVIFVKEDKDLVVVTAHWEKGPKPPRKGVSSEDLLRL